MGIPGASSLLAEEPSSLVITPGPRTAGTAEATSVTPRTAVEIPIVLTASRPAARRDGSVMRTPDPLTHARNAGRGCPELRTQGAPDHRIVGKHRHDLPVVRRVIGSSSDYSGQDLHHMCTWIAADRDPKCCGSGDKRQAPTRSMAVLPSGQMLRTLPPPTGPPGPDRSPWGRGRARPP